MTDDNTTATGADAPAQQPPTVPLPLPVREPSRRGRRGVGIWIAVGVTVVIAVVAGLSYLAARALFEGGSPDRLGGPSTGWENAALQTPASVWWSGSGRFVVLQETGVDDVQEVVVRDLQTGKTRTLKGYRAVGVEPHAPRVWLVPDKRVMGVSFSSETTPQLTDIAWDGIDSPPAELLALRLDRAEDPRADVDARWSPWPGAAGYAASVEIDINKGGCPGTIRFSKVGSSLNAWSAKVPTDVVTFEPIGWSPSGEYFAVVSQLGREATERVDREYLDASLVAASEDSGTAGLDESASTGVGIGRPIADATVVVFSARDGSVASRAVIRVAVRHADSGPARAVWSATEDALTLLTLSGAGPTGDKPVLLRLTPGAAATAVETQPAPWAGTGWDGVWLAGADGTSTLVASGEGFDTDIFGVSSSGLVRHLGMTRGALAARWSATGGLLTLEDYHADGDWRVFRSDAGGGDRSEVLSAPGPVDTGLSD